MATKKPSLEEQNANLEEGNALLSQRVKKLEDDLEVERTTRRENYDAGQKWKKRATELETEVGQLREELHGITVDKARLEGYIDRARQFDPEPEIKLVTVPEHMIRAPKMYGGAADFEVLTNYGSRADRPQPWYKRDV